MSGFLLPGARRKHNIDTVSRTRRRPTGPCAEEAVGGAASTSVASDCAHQESLACQPLSPRCPQTCEGETGKAVNVDNGLLIRIDNPPEMRESICRDRQARVFFFFCRGSIPFSVVHRRQPVFWTGIGIAISHTQPRSTKSNQMTRPTKLPLRPSQIIDEDSSVDDSHPYQVRTVGCTLSIITA